MSNLVLVKSAYLTYYKSELDALNLCHALNLYGIHAEMRTNPPVYKGQRSYGHEECSFSVWLKNEADYDRAVEFNRGLLAGNAVRGDPEAFVDGIIFGAQLRARKESVPLLREAKRAQKMLSSGK